MPSEARSPKPKTRAAAIKRTDKSDNTKRKYAAGETKKVIIEYLKNGMSIRQALRDTGYTTASYSYYRRSDPDFRERVDDILQKRKLGGIKVTKEGDTQMSFPEFCEEYLGTRLFNHHLQWVDLLEGNDPRNLHPSQVYEKGMPENILVNTPPEHAKSTTLTVNYVTYKICMDPNIRIIIVSKTQEMAKRFLRAVKDRLSGSNVAYDKLQAHFAPEGGFTANSAAWTADCIYLSSDLRDSGEPSPTVQALGIKGQIYGSRADLILMDDCVDSGNAHDYEKQISWIQNEVTSRLAYPGGRLLLIGTRLAPVDLYSEIRKPEWYGEEESPWTYLTQPAVLEFAEDPEDWVTLWPKTNRPPVSMTARAQVEPDEEGLYPMWPGEALRRKRAKMSPRNWSMVYMQDQVSDLAIFPIEKVNALIDGMRAPGVMSPGAPGHRKQGMNGLYVVGGFDPAMTGNSAAVVIGLDRDTGERWLLDCWTQGHLVPDDIRNKIKEWTVKFRINEWRIEKNAMNLMVTQDREIREFLAKRGCILKEHFTGCVPEDVKILTRSGWKAHPELGIGEEVLTHTGWEPVLDISVFDAPEKMYEVDTQNLSCSFTPDHRHLVEWHGNSMAQGRFVTTEELKSNTPIRLSIDPIEGGGIGIHTAALLGWYVCEGQDKGSGINIAQSPSKNPEKWNEIKDHLDALQWSYSIYRQETSDRFHIKAQDAKILQDLAPGKSKALAVEAVAGMTIAEREAFMDACLKGDGHGQEFFNTEIHLIEAFEAAAILNGYTVRRSEHENGNGRFTKNKTCWKVRRKVKRLAHVKMSGRDHVKPIVGSGRVWCPTTASGSWVAMSNGRSFVTGNSNKWDTNFGVASMTTLLEGWDRGKPLLRLPRKQSEGIKALVEQLATWFPDTKAKTDCVMALWFAEIRCRELIEEEGHQVTHMDNKYASDRSKEKQLSVDLDYMAANGMASGVQGWMRVV